MFRNIERFSANITPGYVNSIQYNFFIINRRMEARWLKRMALKLDPHNKIFEENRTRIMKRNFT